MKSLSSIIFHLTLEVMNIKVIENLRLSISYETFVPFVRFYPNYRGVRVVRTEDGLVITRDFREGFVPKGIEIKPDSTHYLPLLKALLMSESDD